MSEDKIKELLDGWGDLWGVGPLSQKAVVRLGPRMRRGLGRCSPSRGQISINPVLFEEGNESLSVEILCHEAAHLAAHLLHGGNIRPHGAEWKSLFKMAGYVPRARLPAGEVKGLPRGGTGGRYEYLHTCRDCLTTFRSARTDRRWRCRKCYTAGKAGKLKVIRKTHLP